MTSRVRRQEDAQRAHDLQAEAGIQGAARTTAVGIGLVLLAHCFWPPFRRQSLGLKAFLISPFTVIGLVFGAEHALLEYEAGRRVEENNIRRQARYDLARQGLVPTETEIAKWRTARDRERDDDLTPG